MEKIILINGQGGVGKSSVAKSLLLELENSAYIDVDFLSSVNPFEFGGKLDDLIRKNTIDLINNFSDTGYQNIIISGLVRNQKLLDKFTEQLSKKVDILFVWLRANRDVRISRKEDRSRDNADKEEYLDFLDKLMPDIDSIEIKSGKSIFINTSSKTIQEVVDEIKLAI